MNQKRKIIQHFFLGEENNNYKTRYTLISHCFLVLCKNLHIKIWEEHLLSTVVKFILGWVIIIKWMKHIPPIELYMIGKGSLSSNYQISKIIQAKQGGWQWIDVELST